MKADKKKRYEDSASQQEAQRRALHGTRSLEETLAFDVVRKAQTYAAAVKERDSELKMASSPHQGSLDDFIKAKYGEVQGIGQELARALIQAVDTKNPIFFKAILKALDQEPEPRDDLVYHVLTAYRDLRSAAFQPGEVVHPPTKQQLRREVERQRKRAIEKREWNRALKAANLEHLESARAGRPRKMPSQ